MMLSFTRYFILQLVCSKELVLVLASLEGFLLSIFQMRTEK